MRTIAEIVADLSKATTDEQRNALMDELAQARSAQQSDPVVQLRSKVTEAASRRDSLISEFEKVTVSAVDEQGNARDFTPDEAEQRGRLSAQIDQAKAEHTDLEDQLRQAIEADREKRMDEKLAEMRRSLGLGDLIAGQGINGIVTGVNEHSVYERGNGISYLRDITVRSFGSGVGSEWSRACERLGRHSQENHHRALDLDKKSTRTAEEEYFLRQMVEQLQDREQFSGAPGGSDRRFGYEQMLQIRALSTASTAGGEFVPPLYLTEQWIAFLRAGRVVANCQHHEDLPDGTMSINVPKVVSGTSVAAQGTQNTTVSMTDLQTEYVTIPVVTFAGQQIVSLQLLERSPIAFDQVVMGDLAKAHAQYVDQQVLNGSGANGQVTGILNTSGINTVTWTQASPTLKGLYGQIGQAKLDVANSLFMPATDCFTAPIVWEWISQTFDTNNRPVVVPEYAGPFNAVDVTADDATAEGAVGRRLNGLATFEDANVPQNLGGGTNQSVVVVARSQENYLYESPIVTRALPQTYGAQMSVLLQLYNYGAFSAARYPTANSVVTGTGLASANLTFNS